MGLSAAAGLNAYIPFLVVALVARFTDVLTLPATYAWVESWWAIGIGSVLLLSEVVLDKIPAVDSVNDAVQTFIRPAMGGLIFAATSAAQQVDSSAWMADHPWVGIALGVLVSGLVHTGKGRRPAGRQPGHGRPRRPRGLHRRGRRVGRAQPRRPVRPRPVPGRAGAARVGAHRGGPEGAALAPAPRPPPGVSGIRWHP